MPIKLAKALGILAFERPSRCRPVLRTFSSLDDTRNGDILLKSIQSLKAIGLMPVVWAPVAVRRDSYNRLRITSVEYAGRGFEWSTSPALLRRWQPSARGPQILVRGLHVPGTAEILHFLLEEDSEYTRMWNAYPKRRERQPKDYHEPEQLIQEHGISAGVTQQGPTRETPEGQ